LEQSITQHIKMRTVTFNGTRFQVSEDPDKLIADFLALVLSDYYILQVEQLFIPDGEGIDDLYGDVNIYAYRARHIDDLPEYTEGADTTQLIENEAWVISASGFCYEAQPIILSGSELRQRITDAKKLVKCSR
jgi:hypothetical protein